MRKLNLPTLHTGWHHIVPGSVSTTGDDGLPVHLVTKVTHTLNMETKEEGLTELEIILRVAETFTIHERGYRWTILACFYKQNNK